MTLFFFELGESFGAGGGASAGEMLLSDLNPEQVDELANEILELNKATEGGGTLLSGAPASALNTASYYTLAEDQAASVFRTIISNHMFADGNKRTAVMAVELLAQKMGLKLVSQEQLLNVAGKVANGLLEDVEEISKQIITK
jgi:death-on-curing family protein